MCQPPYSVLKPLRYKVGGPSEVYASSGAAVFCAGMNPLSLKDLLKGCLLVAFFENLPVLPYRCSKINPSFFFDKAGCTRQFESEFSLRSFAPFFPIKKDPPLISVFFNSLYDPFGSPCRGQKPQGKRGNRSSCRS